MAARTWTATTLSLPDSIVPLASALTAKAACWCATNLITAFAPFCATGLCVLLLATGQLATPTTLTHSKRSSAIRMASLPSSKTGSTSSSSAANYDHRVRVIYPNKTVSTLAGSGGIGATDCASQDKADPLAARFCHPCGVAQDHFGNIIVAEFGAGRIRRVWRDGSQSGVTTVVGSGPIGISGGSSIDSDTPTTASLFSPLHVAIDGADSILVSAVYEHRVRIIFVNGSVRTLAGLGPASNLDSTTPGSYVDNVPLRQARFDRPHCFVMDRQGNVILADFGNHRVRMLCTSLAVVPSSSFSSSSTIGLRSPSTTISPALSFSAAPSATWTGAFDSVSVSASVNSAATPCCSTLSAASSSASPSQSLRLESSPPRSPIARLVSSEAAAWAMIGSGAAAAALAGIAATTSMGHATRMGALMRSVECTFASGRTGSAIGR